MFKIEKTVMGFKGIFITHLYFYENNFNTPLWIKTEYGESPPRDVL